MSESWASCLGGCDGGMSAEHIVSEGLFESQCVQVQGFHWCKPFCQPVNGRRRPPYDWRLARVPYETIRQARGNPMLAALRSKAGMGPPSLLSVFAAGALAGHGDRAGAGDVLDAVGPADVEKGLDLRFGSS